MPKEPKSPQEKKRLELTRDHFTFAEYPHAFRKTWKRKKAQANREKRRKGEELLSKVKPGISSADTDAVAADLTPARLGLVAHKRLKKSGTVTVGEKIRIKLDLREEAVGRKVRHRRKYDALVTSAVATLGALQRDQLTDVVQRIARVLGGGDPVEWGRLYGSSDPIDRAIFFVEQWNRGDGSYRDALRRNREVCETFQKWVDKANRILAKLQRPAQRKEEQKLAAERKLRAVRRQGS